jgi:hypothetical protein
VTRPTAKGLASPRTPPTHGLRFDTCGSWVKLPALTHVEAGRVGAPRLLPSLVEADGLGPVLTLPELRASSTLVVAQVHLEVENQLAFVALCSRFELNLLEFELMPCLN